MDPPLVIEYVGVHTMCQIVEGIHRCTYVAIEVYIHVLVFNPDGIVLVRRILCYLCE